MKTRSFVVGLVVCAVVFVILGGVIRALNAGHHRPEGAAERWLAAVSDTTRKGVRADAVKRAEGIGPVSLAFPLLANARTEGKAAFPDLEVGKASAEGPIAYVPYRLHVRNNSEPHAGVIKLSRVGNGWRVTGCCGPDGPGGKVPSQGGPPPSSAPTSLWVVAGLAGLAVTAGASLLVEWATRSSRRALAA